MKSMQYLIPKSDIIMHPCHILTAILATRTPHVEINIELVVTKFTEQTYQ